MNSLLMSIHLGKMLSKYWILYEFPIYYYCINVSKFLFYSVLCPTRIKQRRWLQIWTLRGWIQQSHGTWCKSTVEIDHLKCKITFLSGGRVPAHLQGIHNQWGNVCLLCGWAFIRGSCWLEPWEPTTGAVESSSGLPGSREQWDSCRGNPPNNASPI